MRSIYFTLFILAFLVSFAQEALCDRTISGRIVALDTEEPLPFATIQIVGTQQGAVADEQGFFSIEQICDEEVDLEVRFLGYKPLIHHHDFHHSNPTIYLAPQEGLLESVVVEAELNAHELKTLQAKTITIEPSLGIGTSVGDILSKSTGVSTLRTGQNVVKPIVHGLHSNRVLIINNGVRHSYQAWGNEHAPELDPSQISRIQLIKGASTVRYGSDALGGVVLIEAPQPQYRSKLSGDLQTGFQTNGKGYGGEFSLGEGYERSAWLININASKQGDLKTPDYFLTNTGKNEIGYSIAGKVHFSRIDLSIYANHFEQELGILRGSVNGNLEDLANAIGANIPNDTRDFSYEIRTPRQETVHDLFKLKSTFFIRDEQFDLQYAFQSNSRKEFDIRRGSNNDIPAINLQLNTHTLDLDWDHTSRERWAGTFGIQLFAQDNNNIPGTNTIPFVPNYNNTNIGLFAIESLSLNQTTFEAGLRYDYLNMNIRGRDSSNDIYRDEIDYQNITFTIGVVHDFNDKITVRSNVGSAWRAPNISELYSFGKHQNIVEFGLWRYQLFPENDSISTRGVLSSDLKEVKSERGLKWITNLTITENNFSAEFTPYINWIQNYFFIRPYGLTNTVRGTFPYFIHDQTDALYIGADLDVQRVWNDQTITDLKASFVYAKDVLNKQAFIGIPPLNVQLDIERTIGLFKFTLSPSWTARQTNQPSIIDASSFVDNNEVMIDRSGTFDFLPSPDAFFLLDASIGFKLNDFSIKLNAENLLNQSFRRYTDQLRYFADDIGFNLRLFVKYEF